jgi:hypothetical protein
MEGTNDVGLERGKAYFSGIYPRHTAPTIAEREEANKE